jgi:hypothetical protein
MAYSIEQTLEALENKGVNIIDPRQVYVSPDVDIERIYPGSVLYPGTRLTGSRTLIGSGAKIGTEGPATVNDSVIGAGASIASGYVAGSTLLPRASVGGSGHLRAGTLLEEEANTAHAVRTIRDMRIDFMGAIVARNAVRIIQRCPNSRNDFGPMRFGRLKSRGISQRRNRTWSHTIDDEILKDERKRREFRKPRRRIPAYGSPGRLACVALQPERPRAR